MSSGNDPARLLQALVDLSDILNAVNTGIRTEAEARVGQAPSGQNVSLAATPDTSGGGGTTYRASTTGVAVCREARRTAAKQLRFALSSINPADHARLVEAGDAIAALSTTLGYQPIHHLYDAEH